MSNLDIKIGPFFWVGMVLCMSGFLLSLVSLALAAYNHQNPDELHLNIKDIVFARIISNIVSQVCIILGFGFIYYNLLKGLHKI